MPVLTPSHQSLLKGETLVIDGSETYISNVPEDEKQNGIYFKWTCPDGLESFC